MSIETLYDLKNVSQPHVHGDRVFYLETQMDKEENAYVTHLYSIHTHTKERKKWGDHGTVQTALALSPNGKWLAYLSNGTTDKKMQIMAMPLDGGSAIQLTTETEGVSTYHWTSNSAAFYYETSNKQEGHTAADTKDTKEAKESNEKEKPMPSVIDKLAYKLDGKGKIPQDRTYNVKKITLSSKKTEEILALDRPVQVKYVSKDESYLILSDEIDEADEWTYGRTVYWHDVSSGTTRSLTSSIPKGNFDFGAMSDTEEYLLLVGHDFEYAFVTQTKVYGYDVKTHQLACLTKSLEAEVSDALVGDFQQQVKGIGLAWLTEEEFLFPATKDGKIQLYTGDRQGNTTLIYDQRLHITDGSLTQDKKQLAITYSTLTNPSELALLDLSTKELRSLYNPNDTLLSTVTLAKPEMFWYKGADEWDIQGWYVPPVEAKEEHPAILYIHGGPQVSYGETFFHEMQVHAANGYGVLMLNPRGGNGYGQDFVKSILGDYGNKDFKDLMIGTDVVLEKYPNINPKELYIAGGSYGGFMTNWAVTHTNRFKRAITQRSISNWISFYGTSDVGAFFVEFQLQRDLSDWEGLWAMSPLAYASNAATPILIIHSEKDLRCPLEQGEQFYIAMKKNNVETKLVLFPQSNHGLSRSGLPHLRMQRLEHIVNWLAN